MLEEFTSSPQALLLATAAAQLTDQDDFGATCTTETQAVLACAQKTCPDIQCDIFHSSQDAVRLAEECGGCTDELWAFAKCGLKAAAEQQCGVPDCNFVFPYPGDQCNEDPGSSDSCKKQCDSSDGAAATGLGFLTAAAAVAAAL